MLTIEKMKEIGANTDEGMNRCMNNEAFYLRMVKLAVSDNSFEQLKEALENKDLDKAFDRAHAMKGVLGNVSLTNVFEPVSQMTELLRSRTDRDYTELLDKVFAELDKYRTLIEE